MKRHAFTLVELLVVVAIVALLIAILLPALSKAKEVAKQVVCMSQQRQIGIAFYNYTNDFQGVLVGGYSYVNGSSSGRRAWYQYFAGPQTYYLMDSEGGGDHDAHPNQSKLNEVPILRCNKSEAGSYAVYTSHHPYACSTKADAKFMIQEINKVQTDGQVWGNYTAFQIYNCPQPGNFFLMGCSTIGRPMNKGVWHFNVNGPLKFNVFTDASLWGAHSDRVNGLYVDGHAQACGNQDLLDAANQPCNASSSGIKVWQLEDGTDVIN